MKVTHTADHITHAVISTEESVDFKISNDPAFFQILSNSLYKVPMLAVVRETLCNAWDAHIEAGLTDTPIEITLNSDHLIIRDFGSGIAHESMGDVYCTYGASTKVVDDKTTGGFGLGCKAPFAYTDHFEVTSHYNGIKSIYAVSRSSASRNGRPGITRLVTLPTEEKGLQVKIPIQRANDSITFVRYIRDVLTAGGIMANLNQVPITNFLKLDRNPGSYTSIVFNQWSFSREGAHSIFVRLGNVIYPLEAEAHFKELHEAKTCLEKIIRMFFGVQHAFVIQAVPGSLSVMPNRESLSIQEKTAQALTELLKHVFDDFSNLVYPRIREVIKMCFEKASKLHAYNRLFDDAVPGHSSAYENPTSSEPYRQYLQTSKNKFLDTCVFHYLTDKKYTENSALCDYILERRFEAMRACKAFDQGLLNQYVRSVWIRQHKGGYYRVQQETKLLEEWFKRQVLGPLSGKLYRENLNPKNLRIIRSASTSSRTFYVGSFAEFKKTYSSTKHRGYLRNALKTIVVTPTRSLLQYQLDNETIPDTCINGISVPEGLLVYILPANDKEAGKKAVKLFRQQRWDVIDLTDRIANPWVEDLPKEKPVDTNVPKTPRGTKPKGYRRLSTWRTTNNNNGGRWEYTLDPDEQEHYIIDPKFFAVLYTKQLPYKKTEVNIRDLDKIDFHYLRPFINEGMGILSRTAIPKLYAKNIPTFLEYLLTEMEPIFDDPAFKEWYATTSETLKVNGLWSTAVARLVDYNRGFRKELQLPDLPSERQMQLFKLYLEFSSKDRIYPSDSLEKNFNPRNKLAAFAKKLADIPANPTVEARFQAVSTKPLYKIIDFSAALQIMEDKTVHDPATQSQIRDIVIDILK